MSDIDAAGLLLAAARRDLQALGNMLDEEAFPLEVFGFHAQQAVEKILKCWLSLVAAEIPRTHNIRHLLVLLEGFGIRKEELWELVPLTAFAVQFRYEAFETLEETFDRPGLVVRIQALAEEVASHFG